MTLRDVSLFLQLCSKEESRLNKELQDIAVFKKKLVSRAVALQEKANTVQLKYSKNWSIAKKAKYVLLEVKKPMTAKDIANHIIKHDNESEEQARGVTTKVAATLVTYINKGLAFRRRQHNEHWYYMLKEWFDENDKLMKEYRQIYKN